MVGKEHVARTKLLDRREKATQKLRVSKIRGTTTNTLVCL